MQVDLDLFIYKLWGRSLFFTPLSQLLKYLIEVLFIYRIITYGVLIIWQKFDNRADRLGKK